jgi:hypothetical protein
MNPNDPSVIHEVESLSRGETSETSSAERRRLPRVSIPSEQFRLARNGKVFAVSDLSSEGMALRLLSLDDRLLFPVGAKIEGWLNIDRRKHRVLASVRNLRGDHVGCEFAELADETRSELARWLSPSELGGTLRLMPMPPGFGSGLEWIWFHGRSGTELLAKVSGGEGPVEARGLEKVIVVLWGEHYVEWSIAGPSTGRVRFADDRDSVEGVFRLAPEWFHADSSLDPAKMDLARTLVNHSKLPESWKSWVAGSRKVPV